jgi:hypothetical protein
MYADCLDAFKAIVVQVVTDDQLAEINDRWRAIWAERWQGRENSDCIEVDAVSLEAIDRVLAAIRT